MAIREYFKKYYKDFDVAFVYPAPRAVKVTFRYGPNSYWTIESVMPDDLQFPTLEDNADWLYGNLIAVELPKVLLRLRQAS